MKRIHSGEHAEDHRPEPGIFSLFKAVVNLAKEDAKAAPTDWFAKRYYPSIYCPKKFLKEWRTGVLPKGVV